MSKEPLGKGKPMISRTTHIATSSKIIGTMGMADKIKHTDLLPACQDTMATEPSSTSKTTMGMLMPHRPKALHSFSAVTVMDIARDLRKDIRTAMDRAGGPLTNPEIPSAPVGPGIAAMGILLKLAIAETRLSITMQETSQVATLKDPVVGHLRLAKVSIMGSTLVKLNSLNALVRQRSIPNEPHALPQDNAFPVFPNKRPSNAGNVNTPVDAMANMNIQGARRHEDQYQPAAGPARGAQGPSQQYRSPPPQGSYGSEQQENYREEYRDISQQHHHQEGQAYEPHYYDNHDDSHYQAHNSQQQHRFGGAGQPKNPRAIPHHAYNTNGPGARSASARPQMNQGGFLPPVHPLSPLTDPFRPPVQRSVTVPQEMMNRPYASQGRQDDGTWPPPPGPHTNFSAPLSPVKPPPRPQTTVNNTRLQNGGQPRATTHQRDDSLGDVYNAYLDPSTEKSNGSKGLTKREEEIEADMPNFDLQPSQPTNNWKRRSSMHLDGGAPPLERNAGSNRSDGQISHAGSQRQNFYQQAHKAQSQPDLRAQGDVRQGRDGGFGHIIPDKVPAVPPVNRQMAASAGPYGSDPRNRTPAQNIGARGPANGQIGPPSRGPPLRGYTPIAQPPRPLQIPVNRSVPPQGQRAVTSPISQRRPSGGQPTRSPMQESNPDALPYHPVYERQTSAPDESSIPNPSQGMLPRPATVRHYPQENVTSPTERNPGQKKRAEKPRSAPVTHQELETLRMKVRSNPSDQATALILAKKLVEAAAVLADEGGRADQRTKMKNREKHILEAHKVVKKLSSNGYPEAMFYLADCHGQGLLGLETDPKEAFTLYQAAAKAGHAQSAYRTAVCCEMGADDGGGTKKDPIKAVQWYRRAASLGDAAAMYKLGMILLKGLLGQQKNLGEAVNWLKRAADAADEDNPHGLHELALLYEGQSNDKIIRDEAYAFSLFQQAAELGYRFSQFRLGQAHEYGLLGCAIDARNSIAWYTKAAAQGEHQSELALSGWYLTGSQGILDQSDTEAYLWARKAACAEPPLAKAMFAMGYFTEVGIGCPRSLEEAKKWYGRAAGKNSPTIQFDTSQDEGAKCC